MSKSITDVDLVAAAKQYDLTPELLSTIITVESGGSGFLPDGRLKVLYERHIMWKRLDERNIDADRLSRSAPHLCGKSWNPKAYPYGSSKSQYDKLDQIADWAKKFDPSRVESYRKSAMESCSLGLFQIMGYHYEACGYPNVLAFWSAMEESEGNQLSAILKWMTKMGLLKALRRKDWLAFARSYNGVGQVPTYSAKLKLAFSKAIAYWKAHKEK